MCNNVQLKLLICSYICSCTSLAVVSRCAASASPSCSAAINLQLLNPAGSKSAYKGAFNWSKNDLAQKSLEPNC